MSPTVITSPNIDLQGTICFGSICMTWDLRGLVKKQRNPYEPIVDNKGRVIMPDLGIY